MAAVIQIARFAAKPEQDEAFGARLQAVLAPTRNEAGCHCYELSRDAQGRWVMFEIWANSEAVEAHLQQPYITSLIADLENYLSGPPEIEPLQTVG